MKLYWGAGTCAIGIHLLLEEIGYHYETERLDVTGGATHRPPFSGINPKGKVPTLARDDGSVLTEFSAIATWLARTHPDASLLASDAEGEARAIEVLAFVEGTIHGQGYARLFAPERFEPSDIVHQALGLGRSLVKAQGRTTVEEGFAILDPQLGRNDYAVGDSFSIADAALFYVEHWAPQQGITMPINVERHYQSLLARPAVHKVLQLWDEA